MMGLRIVGACAASAQGAGQSRAFFRPPFTSGRCCLCPAAPAHIARLGDATARAALRSSSVHAKAACRMLANSVDSGISAVSRRVLGDRMLTRCRPMSMSTLRQIPLALPEESLQENCPSALQHRPWLSQGSRKSEDPQSQGLNFPNSN